MAVNGALITIASVLSVFNIEQQVDENGEPCLKEAKMSPGMLSSVISMCVRGLCNAYMFC